MGPLVDAFNDASFIKIVRGKFPHIFRIAEIECSRSGKIGMEVGSTRKKALIALLIDYFGESRVSTEIPITEPETDVKVDSEEVYIKTATGNGGVKVSWTVDDLSAQAFVRDYSPRCGILFTKINWGMKGNIEPSGLFWIPLSTQEKILERLSTKSYLNLPRPGTNPRGISLSSFGLNSLLRDEDTQRIGVNWVRNQIDFDPYERWIEYWRE